MNVIKLHIKCTCGRDDKVSEEKADTLPFHEDGGLTCTCGKNLPNKGHGEVKKFGTSWVH
ncbi:hypothetical protein OH460_08920 [Vibrio sp. Makdt]|uniref:hypothetical protein n=1 Tax=Vibrio sp. Makdt TaxID=2998828 RepID=UPI0022CD26DA|nr:hypothetical protein [Vibrio sp. Makdt]MDA0152423.1 hypothetical protein [Vibrio sp. Makdt]